MSVRTTFRPLTEGGFAIVSSQDVEPILENNREWQKQKQASDGLRRTASIPVVIWMEWVKETGGQLDLMSTEDQYKFVQRKLKDPGYAWLRTT